VTDGATHYDVLGVEPSATKDEIREAYQERLSVAQEQQARAQNAKRPSEAAITDAREAEAEVRAAWQVLSDPYQRGRYDATIEAGAGAGAGSGFGGGGAAAGGAAAGVEVLDDDDGGDEDADLTPAQARRKARAEAAAEARANRPPGMFSIERPKTPEHWPAGFHPPPQRARTLAMLVDVAVLAVVFIVGSALVLPAVLDSMYPKETKQLDAANDCQDRLDILDEDLGTPQESASVTRANEVCLDKNAKLDKAYGPELSADESKKQLQNRLENRNENIDELISDLRSDMSGGQFAVSFGIIVVMLLYLVPSTVRSGRTLGKKLFQIRLVQADGRPVTARPAILHYGAPLLFAQFTAFLLGPLSYGVALLGVLTWPRNPNLQGLHDRLAKTIVVDG
jgi:curved DNA-binding protein CbpA